MADKIIAIIDKSTTSKVHVSTSVYGGKPRMDIREYYQDDTGEWKPTKKGVSLDEESFYQLQDALHGLKFDGSYEAATPKASTIRKVLKQSLVPMTPSKRQLARESR